MKQRSLPTRIIRKYVAFLHKTGPSSPTAVIEPYELPESYAQAVSESGYSDHSIQQIADHIGYYLGIPRGIKIRIIELDPAKHAWATNESGQAIRSDEESSVEYSGLYQVMGRDHSEIRLVKRHRYELSNIMAILCHEYAHHYLHVHRVSLNHEMRDEYLADIATAYLGLGFYVLQGYTPITWTSDQWYGLTSEGYTEHSISIGYLTPAVIRTAILLSAPLRKWDPSIVVRSFPDWPSRVGAYFRLRPYRKEYELQKIETEKKS
ncbi:MAG: hypothetical protein GX599_02150 [Chloroflexi bacterium]|nr:hypothetical protein [Chloroflexota bacterium]